MKKFARALCLILVMLFTAAMLSGGHGHVPLRRRALA